MLNSVRWPEAGDPRRAGAVVHQRSDQPADALTVVVMDESARGQSEPIAGLAQPVTQLCLLTTRPTETFVEQPDFKQGAPAEAGIGGDQVRDLPSCIRLRIKQSYHVDILSGQTPSNSTNKPSHPSHPFELG